MTKTIVFLFLLSILLLSCSTQLIVQNPDINIRVNGQFKGKGTAEISRMGAPRKIHITTDYNGVETGDMYLRRKFDYVSVLLTIYTYGAGIFFSWRYPETVFIPTRSIEEKKKITDPWDTPPDDKW